MPEQQKEAKYWEEVLKEKKILWQHNGNPKIPHIVHPCTGLHSDSFFHSRLLAENPFAFSGVTLALAKKLLNHFWNEKYFQEKVIRAVGVGENSMTLAHDIARYFGSYGACRFAYAKQDEDGPRSPMTLSFAPSLGGEYILLCADEIIADRSIELVAATVQARGGTVLPIVATLFNGSGLEGVGGKKIFSLIDHPVLMREENDCLLCTHGSRVIYLKDQEDWKQLFAE